MDIFDALEEFNGTTFPLCIKELLQDAAYNTKTSLMLLNEKTLAEIENYLVNNGKNVIDNLSCCYSAVYRNQQVFSFLLGHKSYILAIPDQIREMNSANKKKRRPMNEFKKLMTSAELKALLLNRLNQSVVNIGFDHRPFMEDHINAIQTMILDNEMTAKCTVRCFNCPLTVSALYKGYWQTSNILRHVKTHCFALDSAGVETQPQINELVGCICK